jgi:UDP-3-O-[3-hydroxymyristoyl] glucosamine N-acyltransferase
MAMRLAEVATHLDCELRGDGDVVIERVAPIETAGPGDLTFLANPRYARHLSSTRAAAVILASDAPETTLPSLRTAEPYLAFARALPLFYVALPVEPGIHPTASIAETAVLGKDCKVGAYTVIGARTTIGDGAVIGPHVVIYPEVEIGSGFRAYAHVSVRERVRIGSGVVLHCGVVIGSDGFGYIPTPDGKLEKLVQGGDVVLEDDVEIGANSTVDRATVGTTRVRRGAKLDNLVMIGHGCDVGENSVLAAQAGLSGSTRLGSWVRVGGQSGFAGHIEIGDGVEVAAKTGVANSVPGGTAVAGTPAIEIHLWRRMSAALLRLPELLRRVRRLEKVVGKR